LAAAAKLGAARPRQVFEIALENILALEIYSVSYSGRAGPSLIAPVLKRITLEMESGVSGAQTFSVTSAPAATRRASERRIPPTDVFRARAEGRAMLFAAGKLPLQHQAAAIAMGLIAQTGHDAVQAIMVAATFGEPRCLARPSARRGAPSPEWVLRAKRR
jgi:hypothetical protein